MATTSGESAEDYAEAFPALPKAEKISSAPVSYQWGNEFNVKTSKCTQILRLMLGEKRYKNDFGKANVDDIVNLSKICTHVIATTGVKIETGGRDGQPMTVIFSGREEQVKKAKLAFMTKIEKQYKLVYERLSVQKIYHPFVCGPDNSTVRQMMYENGVIIDVPSYHVQSDEIVVSGEKKCVMKCKAKIMAIYEERKRTCRTLSDEVRKSQHKYVIGLRSNGLHEILAATGVSVEVPPFDDLSETITLRGEQEMLSLALSMIYSKQSTSNVQEISAEPEHHKYPVGRVRSKAKKVREKTGDTTANEFKTVIKTKKIVTDLKAERLEVVQDLVRENTGDDAGQKEIITTVGTNESFADAEKLELTKDLMAECCLAKGSDAVFDFMCTPCADEGNIQESLKYCLECNEYLCVVCVRYHLKFTATKKHTLNDNQCHRLERDSAVTADDYKMLTCLYHPDRIIEMYCGSHDMVYCSLCIDKDHRQCSEILEVDKAAKICRVMTEFVILQHIDSLQADIQATLQKKEINRIALDRQMSNHLKLIEDTELLMMNKVKKLVADAKAMTCTSYDDLKRDIQDEENILLQAITDTNELRGEYESQEELDSKRKFARYILHKHVIFKTEQMHNGVEKDERKLKCFINDELIKQVTAADFFVEIIGCKNSLDIKEECVKSGKELTIKDDKI